MYVDQAGFTEDLLASALGLKACAVVPGTQT